MNRMLRIIYSLLLTFGFDPRKTIYAIMGLPAYFRDLRAIKRQVKSTTKRFPFARPFPCLSDRYAASGSAKGHYFHQDLLVARRIFQNKPQRHLDVGSRIDGFVAHVASYRTIEVIDIRPLTNTIPNVTFMQADMMAELPEALHASCDSLSCLHALEHFGLGRYGDPVNYDGDLLGLKNLHTILKPGGKLYFSVPIGSQRIEFNGHRIYAAKQLFDYFDGKYRMDGFSFVDDKGALHEDIEVTAEQVKTNFGCLFGCGIFELTKL